MKRLCFTILLSFAWLSLQPLVAVAAQEDGSSPVLLRMDKEDGLINSQLILTFTSLPEYKVKASGQRIDVNLQGVVLSKTLRNLAPDSALIDVILAKKPQSVVSSFLMRRPPARVSALTHSNPARIILTLFWEQQSNARPAISYRIDGSVQVQVDGMMTRKPGSDYEGRWLQFFDEYRSPFTLKGPVHFSVAPLTAPADLQNWKSPVSLSGAIKAGNWALVRDTLASLQVPPESAMLKRQLWAEALLRTGQPQQALSALQAVGDESINARVRYLTAVAQARVGDTYGALVTLTEMKLQNDLAAEWEPRIALLQGEIALSTGSIPRALNLLTAPDVVWPEELKPLQKLRTLDGRAAQARYVGAAEAYRPWLEKSLIYSHPLSLGQATVGLIRDNDFALAKELLVSLEKKIRQPAARAMTLYAEILADDQLDPLTSVDGRLHQIRLDYPDTEGAYRAWLLLLDRQVLGSEGQDSAGVLADYQTIAQRSLVRSVRQEASFKYGLLLYLNGRLEESIDALSTFRRGNFRSPLRSEASAILVEALPIYIQQLIDKGEDMDALVLVERYRSLLLQGGLSSAFLHDLALSMNRLGLWERSVRVYLYLLDAAEKRPDIASRLYLPLIELYLANDEPALAERYAREYFDRYSLGDDRCRIYECWLRAVHTLKKGESLMYLLGRPDRPSDDGLEALACELYWELENYEMVQRLALRVKNLEPERLWRARYLQAESLYRLGRYRQAHELYKKLQTEPFYLEPSLYRQARIQLAWKRQTSAKALLDRLISEGRNDGWKALAQDLLSDLRKP